jgi:hypothetical protein
MTPDARAHAARLTLQRDRDELQAAFLQDESHPHSGFPRSATFRWIAGHFNARSLASTAVTAVLFRPSLLQILGSFLHVRRSARQRALTRPSLRRTRHQKAGS